MEHKHLFGRLVRSRTPRCTRNETPQYSSKKPRIPRTKASSKVKLTEEQRISILEVLNRNLRFSRDAADVASSKSIIKLAEKMNVPSFVVCDMLGITAELNEIISISSHLTKEEMDATLGMLVAGLASSENAAEVDDSEKSADEMDETPCPEETESIQIINNWNKIWVCSNEEIRSDHCSNEEIRSENSSNEEIRSENSSNVKLTRLQKDSILEMLEKDLDSSMKVGGVGSREHIRKLASEIKVPTSDMREWLGVTDNLNQVIANSNVKVRGFECEAEAKEEVVAVQKEVACPEKFIEDEGGLIKVIAKNCQEPEEELTPKLAPLVSVDEEEILWESSKSLVEDDEEFLSCDMEVSANDFPENVSESIHDAWTEGMQEYLKVSPVYEDGNALECEMLLTVVENKTSELEVDKGCISGNDATEAPAAGPPASKSSSKPGMGIKRKTRIDDYFSAVKSIKKA